MTYNWRGIEIADGVEVYVNDRGTYIRLTKRMAPHQVLNILKKEALPTSNLQAIGLAVKSLGEWVLLGPPVDRDGKLEIEISKDKLSAYAIYYPPLGRGRALSIADCIEEVKRLGIKRYDISALEEALQHPGKRVLIAIGKPPEHGKDAEVIERISPEVSISFPDGDVDWHSVSAHVFVTEGAVILEKIPPTPGVPGEDIFGNEIPPLAGKDIDLRVFSGDGTAISPDGLRLIAARSGILKKIYGKYVVEDTLVVNGDVNYEVGNIVGVQNVRVYGDVLPGFKIVARGDVYIQGSIDDAIIECDGNLKVDGHITHRKGGYVRVGGHLLAGEIIQGNIDVGGHLIVGDLLMHSKVRAGGKVYVMSASRGKIVGGEIYAGEDVVSPEIGNDMGTQTTIYVGYNVWVKQRFDELTDEVVTVKRRLIDVDRELKIAINKSDIKKVQRLMEEKNQLLEQWNRLKSEYDDVMKKIHMLRTGNKVYVRFNLYLKTRLVFYDRDWNPDRIYSSCVIGLNDREEVEIRPWSQPPELKITELEKLRS